MPARAAMSALVAGPGVDVQLRRHFAPSEFRVVHGLYGVRRWYRFTRRLGLHSETAVATLFRLMRGHEPRHRAYRAILVVDKPASHE